MIKRINKTINSYLFKQLVKTLKKGGITVLIIGLVTQLAHAQDKTLSLDEAIKLGIANSKTLKLSQSKIDAAVSQYNQVKDQVLPTGSASFTYDRAQIPANTLDFGSSTIHLPDGANAYLGLAASTK